MSRAEAAGELAARESGCRGVRCGRSAPELPSGVLLGAGTPERACAPLVCSSTLDYSVNTAQAAYDLLICSTPWLPHSPGWRVQEVQVCNIGSCRVEQKRHLTDVPLSVRMNCAITANLIVQLLRFREGQKYLGFTDLLRAPVWWCALLEIPKQSQFLLSVSPKYTFTL